MKPGDVVKVKLSGKDQRKDRYGLFLGTEKGGKDHLFRIFTGDRVLKLKRRSIQRMEEIPGFEGDLTREGDMSRFLKKTTRSSAKGGGGENERLEMTPEEISRKVRIRDLWTSIVRTPELLSEQRDSSSTSLPSLNVEVLASTYFPDRELTKGQVRAVEEILEPCRRPGMPYFSKGNRRNEYTVYSREEMDRVEDHMNRLNDLKAQYVEWTFEDEGEEEGGEGSNGKTSDRKASSGRGSGNRSRRRPRKVPKLLADDPTTIALDEEQKDTLEQLLDWSERFFPAGGWDHVDDFGLGGTPITRLEKFSLSKFLEFFGTDLAGERHLETPSALLEVLLRLKRITWREASELLLTYKVTSKEVPFFLEFPLSSLSEASSLPEEPDPKEFEGRKDLRDQECYTIDPPDAKDFDDAVGFRTYVDPGDGIEKAELYVHIADVSHYVLTDRAMDDDARRRATSVYLPTGVLPMLPRELSENLCSLRGGVNRLAFSTRMVFDAGSAELIDWDHHRSVIRVNENLSYDHVNDRIADEPESLFARMSRFSRQLGERARRLDIVTKERKIRFKDDGGDEEDGGELSVTLKSPSPATRMIEQFMVITNEAVARTTHESGMPSVYRIHPLPDRTDVERWNNMCDILGFEVAKLDIDFDSLSRTTTGDGERMEGGRKNGKGAVKDDDVLTLLQSGGTLTLGGFGGAPGISMGEKVDEEDHSDDPEAGLGTTVDAEGDGRTGDSGKDRLADQLVPMEPEDLRIIGEGYRKALNAVSKMNGDTKDLLYQRILSTMPRAVYSVNNHGHFGLNSLCYTHFTSPIRRYPDVLVHRILGDLLEGKPYDESEKRSLRDDLEVQLDICNDQSKAAEDLERKMIDVALATRASLDGDYHSSIHTGSITGITPTSCFLSLDGVTEGRIPMSRLSKHRLSSDGSGTRIILGRIDDEVEYHRIVAEIRKKGSESDGGASGRSGKGDGGEGGLGGANMGGGEAALEEDEGIELYRLGQKVRCAIHSVELSEGKVDLSMRD